MPPTSSLSLIREESASFDTKQIGTLNIDPMVISTSSPPPKLTVKAAIKTNTPEQEAVVNNDMNQAPNSAPANLTSPPPIAPSSPVHRRHLRRSTSISQHGGVEELTRIRISGYSIKNQKIKDNTSPNTSGCVYNIDVETGNGPLSTYTIGRCSSTIRKLREQIYEIDQNVPITPPGGLYSKMKLILNEEEEMKQRITQFQIFLDYLTLSDLKGNSRIRELMANFIGQDPALDKGGYVSLSSYGAPTVDLSAQVHYTHMRKRATSAPSEYCLGNEDNQKDC